MDNCSLTPWCLQSAQAKWLQSSGAHYPFPTYDVPVIPSVREYVPALMAATGDKRGIFLVVQEEEGSPCPDLPHIEIVGCRPVVMAAGGLMKAPSPAIFLHLLHPAPGT